MNQIDKETILDVLRKSKTIFKATQHELCLPIIRRIHNKMINEIKFDEIKVCDGLIIDGHHRYISSLLAEKTIHHVPSSKTSATVEHEWEKVDFVELEYRGQNKSFK